MSPEPDLLLQVLANTAAKWAIYVAAAVGFGLLYRALRVFHLSFAAIIGAAPYLVGAATKTGEAPLLATGFALLAVLGATLLSEVAIFRPLDRRGAGGEGGMIASLGVYALSVSLLGVEFGFSQARLYLTSHGMWSWGGIVVSHPQALAIGVGLATITILAALERSEVGARLRALGDNPRLLALYGQDIGRARIIVWCWATAFAATAGIVFAMDIGIDTRSGMQLFLAAAVVVFLGGVERPAGWVLAAAIVATAENIPPLFIEAKWSPTIVYGLTLLLLIARPNGLAGVATRRGGAHG